MTCKASKRVRLLVCAFGHGSSCLTRRGPVPDAHGAPSTLRRIVIAAALAAVAIVPASASAWTGNTFRSPTGNLVCKYRAWTGRIACGSYASQKIVSFTATTRPVQGNRITFGDEASHLLAYGTDWHTYGYTITCSSRFNGIRCVNKAGWSFLIYRQGADVYYRGAFLWTL